jgi:hypothetical protein
MKKIPNKFLKRRKKKKKYYLDLKKKVYRGAM